MAQRTWPDGEPRRSPGDTGSVGGTKDGRALRHADGTEPPASNFGWLDRTGAAVIQRATIARDVVEKQLEPTSADVTARQINGAAGNPRMTPAELKELGYDDCPPF